MTTSKDAKIMAKSLRKALADRNVSLSHSECLEIVSRQFGFVDWNTLSAKLLIEERKNIQALSVDASPPSITNDNIRNFLVDSMSTEPEPLPEYETSPSTKPWTTCSFCGKPRNNVGSLIGGCEDRGAAREHSGPERSNVFICNICVTDCAELLEINSTGN